MKNDCPYYDDNASVCDDGDCGCYECYRRIEKLKAQKKKGGDMKKFILLTLASLIVVGCDEMPPKAQLDIINGTEYIVTGKSKNADEYTYCYRLIKFRQDNSFDYGYRDTSNYNVGDTIILTVKKK